MVNIRCYFPLQGTNEVAHNIVSLLIKDRYIEVVGLPRQEILLSYLQEKCAEGIYSNEQKMAERYNDVDCNNVRSLLSATLQRCERQLPLTEETTVFCFPWNPPNEEMRGVFEGVYGTAPYRNTIHLFIDSEYWSEESLWETIAHEWTHLAFYEYNTPLEDLTLLDSILLEGLAEVFREDQVGGDSAPWSIALSPQASFSYIQSLRPYFSSQSLKFIQTIMLGDEQYPQWLGYSMGYHVVKRIYSQGVFTSWSQLLQINSHQLLEYYDDIQRE